MTENKSNLLQVLNLSGNELSASDALEVIKVVAAKPTMTELHIDSALDLRI